MSVAYRWRERVADIEARGSYISRKVHIDVHISVESCFLFLPLFSEDITLTISQNETNEPQEAKPTSSYLKKSLFLQPLLPTPPSQGCAPLLRWASFFTGKSI